MNKDWDIDTLAVRAGTERSQFNEHSEALFLTSSFVFDSAAQAAARFSGAEPGNVYSRFTNPTVTMFEQRLAALEGGEDCLATSSGMAAILTTCMAALSAGDHIVSSQSIFGSTVNLFNTILSRFGVTTSYVALSDPAQWEAAIRPNTKLFYVETPSNPLMELADIAALAALAKQRGIVLVIDNCFCTPALQRPFEFGADVVIHSATKYLDGQGRVLGGAVVGTQKFIRETILPFLRTAGPTLSAFNAWVLLKGLETLSLRMERQSASALTLARWLEQQPQVRRVYYPGLESHPQHALALRQQKSGGAIVSFDIEGGRDAAWRLIDQTKLCSITANLGDTKTTITHPASTTHARITPEARAAAGISEDLIRVAVGLEAVADLQQDLQGGVR
ncbi:MAG: O-succinylhomoserine sulfhydrylase [Burkholderiaceae bacterium]|nr:MAG: O-succinylhomoserine sulfhydrylase [Burkholderiaceae bacterium]